MEALRFLGVKAIVAMVHAQPLHRNLNPAQCPPQLADQRFLRDLSPDVDAVIVGDSGGPATCRLLDDENSERIVAAPASHGRSVAVVDLAIDSATGEVVRPQTAAFNQTVNLDIPHAQWAQDLISQSKAAASERARDPIGVSRQEIPFRVDPSGESALANLITDAQLTATRGSGAQLALSNPASLRTNLQAGKLSYTTLHDVQPYGDRLMLVTLSGSDLRKTFNALVNDFETAGPAVSSNVRYTIDRSRPRDSRVTAITIDGQPVSDSASYKVTVNEFFTSPEFGNTPLTVAHAARATALTDVSALRAYVEKNSPVTMPKSGRITVKG